MIKHIYSGMLLSALTVCLGGVGSRSSFDLWSQSLNSPPVTVQGQLVVVEGMVELKPKGSPRYSRVSMGALFSRGDLLRVAPSSKAVVVCADATKHPLKKGINNLPCTSSREGAQVISFDRAWVKVNPTRGDSSNSGLPIIISPRKTKLLNSRPTLRWTPVAGMNNYIVNVRGWNFDWSINAGSKTELPYPPDQDKQLMPGATYLLTVTAGNRSSNEEGAVGQGFTLLPSEQAQTVRDTRQKIDELDLSEAATRFLVAQTYAGSGLYAEAIEQLLGLPIEANRPAIAQLLGDLYFNIGLNRRAEEQYLLAFKLAEREKDLLAQARAQCSLGRVYEMGGNKNESVKFWRQARELCQQLMNTEMIREIEEALTRLRSP